mmetsp:Transcript_120630/g.375032  ORF Transcript_120630/g.375032 Transcript_120630/m.375032 type:complete len:645 (+) Transcript_120630:56-1990(+)
MDSRPSGRTSRSTLLAASHRGSKVRRLTFGTGSLFDAEVVDADALPFEMPVAKYLEETLIGMCGAPVSHGGDQQSAPEARTRWRLLRKAVALEPVRGICAALVWVAIGVLFGTVAGSAIDELRSRLSRSWFLLTLELGGLSEPPGGASPSRRDSVLETLPTFLVQVLYRLIVDAFPPESAQFVQSAEALIEKLACIVHYEVTGFQMSWGTADKLRRQLFRANVLEMPFVSQVESMKTEMRQKKLEQQKAQHQALAFGHGDDGRALEEQQLEHVMELREQSSPSPSRPRNQRRKELGVDRYTDVALRAEELFLRHMGNLYPEGHSGAVDEQASTSSSAAPSPLPVTMLTPRRQRERREAEQAERRRRDELLAARIAAPLPEVYYQPMVDMNRVSPIFDQQLGQCGAEQQPSRAVRQRGCEVLPRITTRAGAMGAGAEGRGHQRPVDAVAGGNGRVPAALGADSGLPAEPLVRGSGSRQMLRRRSLTADGQACRLPASSWRARDKLVSISIDPPGSIKNSAVMRRLEQQREACQKQSFDEYSKEYDLATGLKKQRLDPARIAGEENGYLETMASLVGSRSEPALKLLNPVSRTTSSHRARVGSGLHTRPLSLKPIDGSGSTAATAVATSPVGNRPLWNELTTVRQA